MTETAEKSGVLFYLAVKDRRFAVIGDSGIHRRVPPEFWPAVARAMEGEFRAGRFAAGLERGVATVGEGLASLFSRRADDRNELDNGIVER